MLPSGIRTATAGGGGGGERGLLPSSPSVEDLEPGAAISSSNLHRINKQTVKQNFFLLNLLSQ